MVNVVPVERSLLAGKGWRRPIGYAFAAQQAVVALVASEFPQAALALPICFVEQSGVFVPVMLTSPLPGHNAVVGPDGQWLVGYVPAALRVYPFSLGPSAGQANLCVNEDSGLVVEADGTTESFFATDGSLSPTVASIFELLRRIDGERLATNRAVVALSDVGLIKRWPLVVPVGDERIPVEGVYCVDEVTLNALDDRALIEVRSGLGMAYAQLLSMGQASVLSRVLLIQRQMAQVGQRLHSPGE